MIDYVLNATKQSDLFYVGHSQGSTAFFVMCSERPEYNKKIKLMHALAPVAYIDNAVSPVLRVADVVPATLHVRSLHLSCSVRLFSLFLCSLSVFIVVSVILAPPLIFQFDVAENY